MNDPDNLSRAPAQAPAAERVRVAEARAPAPATEIPDDLTDTDFGRGRVAGMREMAAQAPAVPEELRRLSEAAIAGQLTVSGVRSSFDEKSCTIVDGEKCLGLFVLPTANGSKALEALADAKFAAACWNFVRKCLAADAAKNRGGGEHGK